MNEVKMIFRFWGISVKRTYKIPGKIGDLSEKQYLALVQFLNGEIKEYKVIAHMYNIPVIPARIISRFSFWVYSLIVAIETLGDLTKPCDHFLIKRIPGTKLKCENNLFKGVSFMQFMFADTMYSKYLQSQDSNHLHSFIATFYIKEGEQFNDIDMIKRLDYISKCKVKSPILEAVLLNFMMMKKWLANVYPYMFSSADQDVSSTTPAQKQKWLDIFDSFVNEDIANTDYYKNMDCMDAFRIINRRIRDYKNETR